MPTSVRTCLMVVLLAASASVLAQPANPVKKWPDFPGPVPSPRVVKGDAWAVVPQAGKPYSDGAWIYPLKIRGTDGDDVIVGNWVGGAGQITKEVAEAIPSPFVVPLETRDCASGDVALVACTTGAPAEYARLKKTKTGCEATVFLELRTFDATHCERLRIGDAVSFGARVAYRENDSLFAGTFIANGPLYGTYWVVGGPTSSPPKLVDIAPMRITQVYKKGAKVLALKNLTLEPGVIKKVIKSGVAYEVKFKSDKSVEEVSFANVTAPLQ